jgi:tetratricopeptide (TPR) repeat protein
LLLLGLTVIAYANSFAGAFHFDDHAAILEDRRLQSAAAFGAGVGDAIRPFAKATFLVDRMLYGSRPTGYHVLNLLLHLASGLLVWRILRHRAFAGADPWVAFTTTLLFLLHPLATEAVTYISGRPTGLMTCTYLAAFLLFLDVRVAPPGSGRRSAALACAAACLTLSLLSKEVAVVFPALLLLYEWLVGRSQRPAPAGALLRVHLPLAAVVGLFLCYAAFNARYAFLLHYSMRLRDGYENLLTQANTVVWSISLFVRPSALNFDHDLPLYASIMQGPVLFSIAALGGLVAAAVALARRAPLFSFGILWFLLHLLPTNSIVPRYDLLSERNLYLPSIGLYLAAACCAAQVARRLGLRVLAGNGGVVAGSLLVALALTLAGFTASRNAVYADAVTLWSDAVDKSPRKARPHANLGRALAVAGDSERAIEQFRIALTLDPLDPVAQRNLLRTWTGTTQPADQGWR